MQCLEYRPYSLGRFCRLLSFAAILAVGFFIVFISLSITSAATGNSEAKVTPKEQLDAYRQQIAARDVSIRTLQERARQVKEQLTEVRGRERTLENQILALDRQIESIELEMSITEGRIESAKLHIEELQLEIKQKQDAITIGEARLGETLRAVQFAEENIGTVELVFAARPFSEIFDALRAAELLDTSLALTLQDIKRAKVELEQAKLDSENEKEEAEKLRDELLIQQELLGGQQDEREGLLNVTQREEKSYQNLLKDIEAQQRGIQREILSLEAQLRYAIDPSSLPGKGVLAWPVASVRITQGYGSTGSTGFINDQYEFHNGIDMGASTQGVIGDPIFAAASGTVAAVGNTGRYAYGKWVALDHHNGLTTLYAHLSLQVVGVGQQVEVGQVIGRMGSTGFSTGPHLHFTVYATETFRVEPRSYGLLPLGGSLNPLHFLQ